MTGPEPFPTIVWFRNDLRVGDHPALADAAARGPVVPLYIFDDRPDRAWPLGGAARWWLDGSLRALGRRLEALGSPLILRRGEPLAALRAAIADTKARRVVWTRRYDPDGRALDGMIKAALKADGLSVESFPGSLLHEPLTLNGRDGHPYKVFSPFWRALSAAMPDDQPLPAPERLVAPTGPVDSDDLDEWRLTPSKPDWADGLRALWTPGEAAARTRLDAFLDSAADRYGDDRNTPGIDGTSRLSPRLRWGELSPRQIWYAARVRAATPGMASRGLPFEPFLREVGWREFSYHLLIHCPDLPEQPLNPRFARFPWVRDDAEATERLATWSKGRTGYPIVDAGMRQLWRTGWMHNRVRMIVGSFLVKHLLLPWQRGEEWFWDTLVDADLASNAASWQWIAGCGADAAPYFRIFNPVLQGEKFDPDGAYVRHWVPELASLPDRFLHKPWLAPADVLAQAGVTLGNGGTYPAPMIDHGVARDRALAAFAAIKESAA